MNLEDLEDRTVLYGIYKGGRFKEKCRYAWRQYGNPAWVSASIAKTYNLGDITTPETMARLTLALNSTYIFTYEKITLATTGDGVVVFRPDMCSVASALEAFEHTYKGSGFLLQIASGIKELYKSKKCNALAFDMSHKMPQWKDYRLPENPDNSYINIRQAIHWTNKHLPMFIS